MAVEEATHRYYYERNRSMERNCCWRIDGPEDQWKRGSRRELG
jgi:hypothetical protein